MPPATLAQSEIIDRLRVLSESRRINDCALAELEKEYQEKRAGLLADSATLAADIAALLMKLQELNETGAVAPVPVMFNDDDMTLHWAGGSVALTRKPFEFIKTLYFAGNRQMSVMRICTTVWNNPYIKYKSTLSRLCTTLKQRHFPYRIKSVKHTSRTIEMKDRVTKETRTVIVGKAIRGFRLVAIKSATR